MKNDKINITFLSTWPEISDGIATFCENLAFNLPKDFKGKKIKWNVIRNNWVNQTKKKFESKVIYNINYDCFQDYKKAAEFINNINTDIVVIQFINGIYGKNGRYIFNFIDHLKKPILIILHSVAMLATQKDIEYKQQILRDFSQRNIDVVVMSKIAEKFLINTIGFSKDKVHQIYHGAPKFRKITQYDKNNIKNKLNFKKEEKILFAYGILREDKGIEEIVRALHIISKSRDDVRLLLCGDELDPKKKYTKHLKKIIDQLDLKEKIKFIDRFISQNDIGKYLQICDIFITAQHNLGLHSSGTLSYALSTGTVIISSSTFHAKELIKDKGIIIPDIAPDLIANSVMELLVNKSKYFRLKKNSLAFGKNIYWSKISKDYLKTFIKIIEKSDNRFHKKV